MAVAIRTITRLQDADDAPVLGAGQDGYALTWDNASGAFVATALFTGGLLATGATAGATSQAQAFTNGIIGPSWKPASDSTTALQLQNAAGTAVVTVDTTNGRLGVNATPSNTLQVVHPGAAGETLYFQGTGSGRPLLRLYQNNTANRSYFAYDLVNGWNLLSLKEGTGTLQPFLFGFAANAPTMYLHSSGYVGIGGSSAWTTPVLQVMTADGSLYRRVGINILNPDSTLHAQLNDAATNAVSQLLTLSHNTSGTAAAGFGSGVLWELKSSTTDDQSAARVQALWYEATHATRKADLVLTVYDTAEREGLRIRGDGSAPAIGFLGAAPVARQAHVADPSGGATVDAEARSAINSILATLETFGFHATS